ncbi:MAG: alkaline phosphatase PafA [Cryomorphaceae bacterium]|nr:alkaline phosphatase family protein [Flavobacteriales bacterium]
MIRTPILFAAALLFSPFAGKAQSTQGKPKLVVGIVIDQLRTDYLYRFEDGYSEGGFKRLMREGFFCANHHFSFMPTYTGPGHASVYTGTTPSGHGIVSNNWYDPRDQTDMYCVEDKSVRTTGIANADGQMSPLNLKSSTITDELMLHWNMRSIVTGVSIKDRGAILPAGHLGEAYWYSKGKFITSSYYMDELPAWVDEFNARSLPEKYVDNGWDLLLPEEKYAASQPDDSPYEATMAGEDAPVFPRDLQSFVKDSGFDNVFKNSPSCNTFVLDFAIAAMEGRNMGSDDITDFLTVSFSSTDYLGHAMGTRSREVQDMYLRLDRDLAEFFEYLDENIGKGEYTVFLTSDHGAADVPQFNSDLGMPGGYIVKFNLDSLVKTALNEVYPEGEGFVKKTGRGGIYLNRTAIAKSGAAYSEVCNYIAALIRNIEGVYNAYPAEAVMNGGGSHEFPIRALSRGLYPSLAADVVIVSDNGWISYGPVGTTHGSPWTYDTHVPLIFFGKGIAQGVTYRETNIRDIAPTLSMMLKIGLPSAATGVPVQEAIAE